MVVISEGRCAEFTGVERESIWHHPPLLLQYAPILASTPKCLDTKPGMILRSHSAAALLPYPKCPKPYTKKIPSS